MEHRAMLDRWLAKGDTGEGEEPDKEFNSILKGKGWTPVNPEYERFRKDSDGDGMSDQWEQYNGRDPEDGQLYHDFACGGWQTEGWQSQNTTNLAGRQGYLKFEIQGNQAVLSREDYNLDSRKNSLPFEIRARSSQPVELTLVINDAIVDRAMINAQNFSIYEIDTKSKIRTGTIEKIELKLEGNPSTQVEIDWIKVGDGHTVEMAQMGDQRRKKQK
ncbi:MAG: hypothetical protein AAF212_13015 [Verrucomicrobiota bacterium]